MKLPFTRKPLMVEVDPNWKAEQYVSIIDEICQIEADALWVEESVAKADKSITPLTEFVKPARFLLYATAAQLTSDLYDDMAVLVRRPEYRVSEEPSGDGPFLLEILTTLTMKAKNVLASISEVTNWVDDDVEIDEDTIRHAPGKMKAAYLQLDNCKSALAVTLAGYDYLNRFNEAGEPLDMTELIHHGGYI